MRSFISKILNISHAQWSYRNFSLHNKANGYLQLLHQSEVIVKVYGLSNTCPEEIPEESKFDSSSLAQQEYWIAAMKAALCAGGRKRSPRHNFRRLATSPISTATMMKQ